VSVHVGLYCSELTYYPV